MTSTFVKVAICGDLKDDFKETSGSSSRAEDATDDLAAAGVIGQRQLKKSKPISVTAIVPETPRAQQMQALWISHLVHCTAS